MSLPEAVVPFKISWKLTEIIWCLSSRIIIINVRLITIIITFTIIITVISIITEVNFIIIIFFIDFISGLLAREPLERCTKASSKRPKMGRWGYFFWGGEGIFLGCGWCFLRAFLSGDMILRLTWFLRWMQWSIIIAKTQGGIDNTIFCFDWSSFKKEGIIGLFSCPGQLNRWHCQWVSDVLISAT